jgi:hypothetical protein
MMLRPRVSALLVAALATATVLGGCKHAPVVTPPPPPLRPQPLPPPPPKTATRTDCDPPKLGAAEQPMTYAERAPRLQEAQALAVEGTNQLKGAEGADLDQKSREQMITDAVATLIAALAADPYNVHATYNLAAAYARINRKQCALNLLDRLIQMRDHASRKVEVSQKLDRLLGRNGVALDSDFRDLRQNETFGCLISNIGSAAPKNCFGS